MKRGDAGEEVAKMQRLLIAGGWLTGTVNGRANDDGVYGPITWGAVSRFQLDTGLRQTGECDDLTLKLLRATVQPEPLPKYPVSPVMQRALLMAQHYLGVHEQGRNDGPEVRRFLKDIGLDAGAPWCMAFVQYCVKMAAQELNLPDPMKPDTGHCMTFWRGVKQSAKLPCTMARAGDIFIMRFSGDTGHTGFVESVTGHVATTIEGNTNSGGSREGDGVYRRERALGAFHGVVRL